MKRFFLPLLILITLASGCAKSPDPSALALSDSSKAAPAGSARAFLAYEHALSMDVEEQQVAAIFEAGQAACREATQALCTVLESRLSSGRTATAFLKFRAKPEGIKKIIAALSQQGTVTEQSTTAEDLASPIADAAKKLAMLKDYRTNLEALRGQASRDVDALIKVSRELAQVQSELEAAQGSHAYLMQRVETEVLKVSVRSVQRQAFWKPIGLALSDFAGNLSQGISSAITGIAYLIPWAIVLLVGVWGGRRLWRRWRGPKTAA